eukprot:scaffold65411_cov32-Tisochrysis_lutea.AAC.2
MCERSARSAAVELSTQRASRPSIASRHPVCQAGHQRPLPQSIGKTFFLLTSFLCPQCTENEQAHER